MTVDNLVDTAKSIIENEGVYKRNMLITYTIPEKAHRKLNEELHYRISKNEEELVYSNIIELTLFDINFKIITENV
jgi:hypothetical protein